MENIPIKVDGVDVLPAVQWNQVPSEIENAILSTGITLSSGDLFQLTKSIANYTSHGDFYTDSGSANSYVLSVQDSKQSPTAYKDGFSARFVAGNTNTGASTVNIATLGVKDIKKASSDALTSGDLAAGIEYVLIYNGVDFILSSQSSLLLPLSGAIQRTANNKSGDTLSVKDFGAVGDGVTDDTVVIQSAINASVGKSLFIPGGDYIVSNLTVPSEVYIYGEGYSTSRLVRKTGATGIMIYGTGVSNSVLRDFEVSGNSYTGDASQLIRFDGATIGVHIEETSVVESNLDGIAIGGASIHVVLMNNICNANKGSGISMSSTGGNHLISDNRCADNDASGIVVLNTDWLRIIGNSCTGNGQGVTQNGGIMLVGCDYPTVVGNQAIANGTGIYFSHGIQFNTCEHGIMSNNLSSANNGSGLDMFTSPYSTCMGNQTLLNNLRGIEIDTLSAYSTAQGNAVRLNKEVGISVFNTVGVIVSGNSVVSNGTLGTATNPLLGAANSPYGIALWGASDYGNYATVTDNNVVDNIGDGANGVGIFFDASCVGVSLTNNFCSGNTVDVTVVAGNLRTARDNFGIYTEQSGAAVIVSGTTSIAVTFSPALTIAPAASGITLTRTNIPTNDMGEMDVTSITTSGFTISCRSDPGAGGVGISWRASLY